jgi:hypothetical protein
MVATNKGIDLVSSESLISGLQIPARTEARLFRRKTWEYDMASTGWWKANRGLRDS